MVTSLIMFVGMRGTPHSIHPNAKGMHLKTDWLEQILAAAQEADVSVVGFGELPVR